MNSDIRLSTSFFNHPKTIKLQRRLGGDGVVCLLRLWSFAAVNNPDGDLSNRDDEDLIIASGWQKDESEFITNLTEIGFLEKTENGYLIHDWEVHQPYAVHAKARSEKAKKAAQARWEKEDRINSEKTKDATSTAKRMLPQRISSAPSPSTSPSPSPITLCQKPTAQKTKFTDSAIKVIEAWNENTGGNIRTAPPSAAHVDTIRKNIRKDAGWLEDYLKAAPMFKNVDDSGWSTGKVSFPWSLRFGTPSKVLADGYPTKTKPDDSEDYIDFEDRMKMKGVIANGQD